MVEPFECYCVAAVAEGVVTCPNDDAQVNAALEEAVLPLDELQLPHPMAIGAPTLYHHCPIRILPEMLRDLLIGHQDRLRVPIHERGYTPRMIRVLMRAVHEYTIHIT